jgi:methylmalonyl-CoA mutase
MINQTKHWLKIIDDKGGIINALKTGWVHKTIHNQALKTQANLDANRKPLIGVNCHTNTQQQSKIKTIDNRQIVADQKNKISILKNKRNSKLTTLALSNLYEGAKSQHNNLLELTMDAIRARATIGECTRALLKVWPRYNPEITFSKNQYGAFRNNESEWHRVKKQVSDVKKAYNRKPKILLCKLGLDGHDRGIKTIAAGLNDLGFEIQLTPLFSTPKDICEYYLKGEYFALGISMLSGSHIELITETIQHITAKTSLNRHNLPLFIGGIIPHNNDQYLKDIGVKNIVRPGTPIEKIADQILKTIADLPVSIQPQQTLQT